MCNTYLGNIIANKLRIGGVGILIISGMWVDGMPNCKVNREDSL